MSLQLSNISNPLVKYGVAAACLYYFGYYVGRRSRIPRKQTPSLSDVFFFSNVLKCHNHLFDLDPCDSPNCMFKCIEKIKQLLRRAKKSLNVCMYIMTFGDITDVLIECHQRGVAVRVITDSEMANATSSQVDGLKKCGIEIRTQLSDHIMHHKFVVIDKLILINGSFNWTKQALCGNEENVVVTTDHVLVMKFTTQFDELWKRFKTGEPRVKRRNDFFG